ncbi:DEAD/DEAH box helicase [Pseudoalteromonas sp. B5MOD-1]|uniref:DEAD/DEAH box helicase n=1 Tax=Pseudoalteromonas TaxID=53246 RepID=UPI000781B60E|nr:MULTISPECIES: DEAD/DEAH box helicase [Pseudoalteromonas]KZY61145.1 RNA helicase [Pseudoalteromonas shioyasakiensis]MCO7205144.1 DEAD/DEAH box helicase [Pseudoalteromonas sp. CnMc7-37]MCZ4249966.1 DEAD/DEAH box helicase [Pseudoalteromonas shioyasakiensis]NRA81301.1 DEAD/DEAH box helicase [Pseudoalteromonas sp.]RZF78075.1 DEAD/DEAH box helicase [Pseudoalteromonas sp. CO109Y]
MNFKSFSFSSELLQALEELNFETLTPVQRSAIPAVRKGKDVLVSAQTGTGKTAAFALPLIQKLSESAVSENNAPSALVLAPTRELAEQIANNFKAFAKYTELKTVCLFGGINLAGQANDLKAGVDIVVATPGRLLDHLRLGNISLANVKHLVLDEADRMLDMGFISDMQTVINGCDEARQILLFSATFPAAIKQFASKVLKQPEIIRVDQTNSTAETVQHVVYPVEERRKQELLSELIGKKNWQQVLVFVNMKETADELVKELNLDGIPAVVCHGDKTQGNRRRALREFKEGKVRVLVATEVAARGIDIEGLPRVINIDLPWLAEDYVHRIGRTGRAGKPGQAISFVSREEENTLFDIEKLIGQRIKRVVLPGYEVSSREVLIDKIGKKPSHLRRSRTNKASGQATGEARAKNRSRIANVRKSLKGNKLSLKK